MNDHHIKELKQILSTVNDNLDNLFTNVFLTNEEKKDVAVRLINRKNALIFAIKIIENSH